MLDFAKGRRFATVLADPPWQFTNKTGKVAPEHKRLSRYGTMKLEDIMELPVEQLALPTSHLYLWCPNAMLPEGLAVMKAWGFNYKSNIVWHKVRKDGGSDGRGVGFYFRNVTELILFGVRGKNARTLAPGRRQVNLLATRKREHSRKPDEQYEIIEACSRPTLSNYSGAGRARGGRRGAIRLTTIIVLPGRRMRIIRGQGWLLRNKANYAMNTLTPLPWLAAFQARVDLQKYGDNAIGLFALGIRFNLDDLDTVAADAITDGADDKKCDIVFLDIDNGYAVVAQCYQSAKPRKEAPANKASDLNTAVNWLLQRDLNDLPERIRSSADDLRKSISNGEIFPIASVVRPQST